MIAKLLLQNSFFVIAMGALLFASAGTLQWPGAWAFLATSAVLGPACGLWLARTDPALLAERLRLTARDGQPAADKKFMLVFVATAFVWFVAIGIDRRAHASHIPLPLEALGLAMYLLSTGFIMWVFHENSFAAPVIKVQAERAHHVISTGPYAWVRHPMYSGALIMLLGTPLALASWWGLIAFAIMVAVIVIRLLDEEKLLLANLPGYAEYGAKVRYRLMPYVW